MVMKRILTSLAKLLASGTPGCDEALRANAEALIAEAQEAIELREALEYLADKPVSLYLEGAGKYSCIVYDEISGDEFTVRGATPLEAIQKARKGQ